MLEFVYTVKMRFVIQSTVGKKMAAVYFTKMPCEPNTALKAQR